MVETGVFELIDEPGRSVKVRSVAHIPFLNKTLIYFVYEDEPKQLREIAETEFYAKTKPIQRDQP